MTVPTGNFRRPSGSGKTGRFTPPGGEAGTGPSGGSGLPPTGAFKGKRPAGGGFPGGAGGKVSKKQQAALKACAKDMPAGARGFAGRGGTAGGTAGGQFSAATIEKFAACVKKNGYTLPKANTSGSGPIYPRSIESNKQFVAASKSCRPGRSGRERLTDRGQMRRSRPSSPRRDAAAGSAVWTSAVRTGSSS